MPPNARSFTFSQTCSSLEAQFDPLPLKMPAWLQEHLIQLHRKLEFAERSDMARESAALRDVAPELDRLRIKALFKAREFLIAR